MIHTHIHTSGIEITLAVNEIGPVNENSFIQHRVRETEVEEEEVEEKKTHEENNFHSGLHPHPHFQQNFSMKWTSIISSMISFLFADFQINLNILVVCF